MSETKEKVQSKKQPTPAEQWDILAAKVIGQELAPKGFKKVNSGSFSGLEIARHSTPGITKSIVRKTQNIGASLVRGFRERVRKKFEEEIQACDIEITLLTVQLNHLPFYALMRKYSIETKIEIQRITKELKRSAILTLDSTDIK